MAIQEISIESNEQESQKDKSVHPVKKVKIILGYALEKIVRTYYIGKPGGGYTEFDNVKYKDSKVEFIELSQ